VQCVYDAFRECFNEDSNQVKPCNVCVMFFIDDVVKTQIESNFWCEKYFMMKIWSR